MAGLSEKHRELKRRRAEIVSKMGAIVKEDSDDKPVSEGGVDTFDELSAALAAIDQRLQRVAAAMQAAAEGAQDADGDGDGDGEDDTDDKRAGFRVRSGAKAPAQAKRDPDAGLKDKRGVKAARYVLGLLHARYNKVSIEKAAEFVVEPLRRRYRCARAQYGGVTGEGGALIPQDFMADLIELLRASTAVRGSNPMEVGMPMGNLTIPRLAGGATAAYQNGT